MSDTPETDILLKQCSIKGRNPNPWKLCRKLERERDKAREALQSIMDWNPKPEPTDRPQTVVRFEADMARAREALSASERYIAALEERMDSEGLKAAQEAAK